jgi:hypothetical protein
VSGTNGIVIQAGAGDTVVLRGLTFEGLGTGLNAVRIISAGNVFIDKCYIDNFINEGIDAEPTGNMLLSVKDTVIRNIAPAGTAPNGFGIFVKPQGAATVNALVDNVLSEHNLGGLRAEAGGKVTARNSAFDGNTGNGVIANAGEINLENSTCSNNLNGVVSQPGTGVVRISNTSVFDNSNIGLNSVTGGQIISFGNNRVGGNGTNTTVGTPTSTPGQI